MTTFEAEPTPSAPKAWVPHLRYLKQSCRIYGRRMMRTLVILCQHVPHVLAQIIEGYIMSVEHGFAATVHAGHYEYIQHEVDRLWHGSFSVARAGLDIACRDNEPELVLLFLEYGANPTDVTQRMAAHHRPQIHAIFIEYGCTSQ